MVEKRFCCLVEMMANRKDVAPFTAIIVIAELRFVKHLTKQRKNGIGGHKMFLPEFVCGILATIGVEILLLIGYAVFRKK